MEGETLMAEGINFVLECQLSKHSINATKTTLGEWLPRFLQVCGIFVKNYK
jgi:hypothetical protein